MKTRKLENQLAITPIATYKKPEFNITTETHYLFFYKAKKNHNVIEFGDPGYRNRLFVNACEDLNPLNCTLPS